MAKDKPAESAAHASLGASSAHRWINCPGSLALIETLPPGVSGSSVHAAEGSAAHALAERCLKSGMDAISFLGLEIEGFEVDEDMADNVQVYVDYCRKVLKGEGGGRISWIEKKFSLSDLNPPAPMFGTADFVALNDMSGILDVIDLKFGRGVLVEVRDNDQLYYYALGAMLELERSHPELAQLVKVVRITIVQPRINHADGLVRYIEVPVLDVVEFAMTLMAAAKATTEPGAPRSCGSWCRWCRASGVCPEQASESLAIAQTEFGDVPAPPAPESLSPEELTMVLGQLPVLEAWAKSVRSYATEVLEAGLPVAGFKLVDKRATRKWRDEATVVDWAEDAGVARTDLYEEKVRSPAQLEKKIGKNKIPTALIIKASSGVTMVPESDKRPAVTKGEEFAALPLPSSTKEKTK